MGFWSLSQILARINEMPPDTFASMVVLGEFMVELMVLLVGGGVLLYGFGVALKTVLAGKEIS
jgi:hypothetical protein